MAWSRRIILAPSSFKILSTTTQVRKTLTSLQAFLPSHRKLEWEEETNHKWLHTCNFLVLHCPHFMAQELPPMAAVGLLQRLWSKSRPGNSLHSASLAFAATGGRAAFTLPFSALSCVLSALSISKGTFLLCHFGAGILKTPVWRWKISGNTWQVQRMLLEAADTIPE